MKQSKRRRLEAKGWQFGSAKEFLKLTDEDVEYIELHFSLAALLTKRRKSLGYTQTGIADLIGSSQSRVAKMEAGDPSVSVDLLIRALLAIGVDRKQVGRAIGA
jgi:DNA-binding XRE family transcriptional regulator